MSTQNTPETLAPCLIAKLADLQNRKREELRGTAPDQRSLAQSLKKVYDLATDEVRRTIENQIAKGRNNMAPDLWKNFEAITAPKAAPAIDKFKVLTDYLELLLQRVDALETKIEASKSKKKGASAPEPVTV